MTSSAYQRMPLDKRPDFRKILGVAGLYTVISGMINGIALVELGTPVGYTSGGCVNSGRAFSAGDTKNGSKILAMCTMFYAGGILAGIWPNGCDGDLVFEGKTSPGMLLSSIMILIGIWMKRHRARPTLAMQFWALSQGMMNATSSSFSAVPMRATHTAGGQTDAAISLGKALVKFLKGEPVPCQRKVCLNAVCCVGMIFGGLLAGKSQKKYGCFAALMPAGALAFSATILPRMIAPAPTESSDAKDDVKNK
ncbi:unnamed protein product [Effrenium voratum]|nr:unnamed protein product [Effrenium voratum]